MMNNYQNPDRLRAQYEKALADYTGGAVPMPFELREHQPLRNNKSTYAFNLDPRAGALPIDRKLENVDDFYVTGMGLGLLVERKDSPGTGIITYYPNAFDIEQAANRVGGAAANAPIVRHLNTIFNGTMTVQLGQREYLRDLPNRRFYVVPETQQNGIADRDAASYGDNLFLAEPKLILRGDETKQISVTIPTFDGIRIAANAEGWEIYLVLLFDGLVVRGGVGKRKPKV